MLNNIADEVKSLLSRRNYRQAYRAWQELKTQLDHGAVGDGDYAALRMQIEQEAAAARDEARQSLDPMRDQPAEQFDPAAADDWLTRLFNATLQDDDPQYNLYFSLVENWKQRKAFRAEYDRVRAQIEDLWAQARQMSREQANVSGGRLLADFYDPALKLAQDAANQSPNNTQLKVLAEEASAERERFASEQEVMTSGGQTGDFVRVLRHVERARDDEYIQVYDPYGLPISRMNKTQAREEVTKQARIYVNEKLGDYLDHAEEKLRRFDPRGALDELSKYGKFRDLERMVDALLRGETRRRLDDSTQAARDALALLEQAETQAQAAARRARVDGRAAWSDWQAAAEIYAGAAQSAVVIQAREDVLAAITAYLETQADELDSLLRQERTADVQELAASLLSAYEPIRDLQQSDVLRRIRQAQEKGKGLAADKSAIMAELKRIQQMKADQAQQAAEALADLRGRYPAGLVERDPQYESILSDINARVNVRQELDRLGGFLASSDLSRVQEALASAQQRAREQGSRFDELAARLEVHADYLRADYTARNEGYEEAIKSLETLMRRPNLDAGQRKTIEARLVSLRNEAEELSNNENRLKAADKALNRNELSKAWQQLNTIVKFGNTQQRASWRSLAQRSLEAVTIDDSFSISDLKELLTNSETHIDLDFADRWRRKLKLYLTAQEARETTDRYGDALQLWESIRDEASGKERLYVLTQIAQTQKQLLEAEKQQLERHFKEQGSDNRDMWLGALLALAEKLKQNASQQADSRDAQAGYNRLDYMAWAIDVDLLYAQHIPDIQKARERFEAIYTYSRQLEQQITRLEWQERQQSGAPAVSGPLVAARKSVQLAAAAPAVGAAMQGIDAYLTESHDISQFAQALEKWKTDFTPHASDFRALQNWYDQRARALTDRLRQQIQADQEQQTTGLSPANLPRYAKLLLLNPNDDIGQELLRRLSTTARQLEQDFQMLLGSLATADGYSGSTGKEKLKRQLDRFNEQASYISLIADVTGRFPKALETMAKQEGDGLSGSYIADLCRQQINRLNSIIQALQQFQQLADNFEAYVDAFGLDDHNWRTFGQEMDDRYREFKQAVRQTGAQLQQLLTVERGALPLKTDNLPNLDSLHPRVRDDLEARYTQRRTVLDRLTKALTSLEDFVTKEEFDEAVEIIDSGRVDEKVLKTMGLYGSYTLPDGGKDGAPVRGWPAVTGWIKTKQQMWNRIFKWSGPFYVSDDPPPPAPTVVNWDAERQQVEALVTSGDFAGAVKQVDWVVRGSNGLVSSSVYALAEASRIVSRPPLADEPDATTDDYGEAIRHAGSKKGEDLLVQMRQHRAEVYQRQLREADDERKSILDRQKKWNDATIRLNDVVKGLPELLAKADHRGFLGRGGLSRQDWDILEQRVNEAEKLLRTLAAISPQHPDYESLEKNEVLSIAIDLLTQRKNR